MINCNTGACCKQQAFDISRQPEGVINSTDTVILWIEHDDVEVDDDIGDVANKAANIADLHKSIHLADCATQSLVTSTEHGYSVTSDVSHY